MSIPVTTLIFTALELTQMYLDYAQRAPSMTEEEANAEWSTLTAKVKASGENFDAAAADFKARHAG